MSKTNEKPFADKEPTIGHWGMWDTKDKCWLGRPNGPLTYKERDWAFIGAGIMTERFGHRIKHRRYNAPAKKFKDEVRPKRSMEQALEAIIGRI